MLKQTSMRNQLIGKDGHSAHHEYDVQEYLNDERKERSHEIVELRETNGRLQSWTTPTPRALSLLEEPALTC